MKKQSKKADSKEFIKGPLDSQYQNHIRLWMLRILYRLKGYRNFKGLFLIDEKEIARFLVSENGFETGEEDLPDLTPQYLYEMLKKTEEELILPATALGVGIDLLAGSVDLNKTERDIIEFAIILKTSTILDDVVDTLGNNLDTASVAASLSVILDAERPLVDQALSHASPLATSGILRIEGKLTRLSRKFDIADGLIDKLVMAHADPQDAMSLFLNKAPNAILTQADFEDYQSSYDLISRYLLAAIRNKLPGVNVLLYGPPGAGKTEMVRSLCHKVGASLFEVPEQDGNGNPYTAADRFDSYQLTQKMLKSQRDCAVIFDEFEDVFPRPQRFPFFSASRISSHESKGWLNKLLESNATPTIWVGNQVSHIDPAYVRRFDLVVELPRPGIETRRRMLEKYLSDYALPKGNWLEKAAHNPHLTPGLIERAVKVVSQLQPDNELQATALYDELTGATLKAMGHDAPLRTSPQHPFSYRTDLINVDTDPEQLVAGLDTMREGRLLFYGAPGTGKTALARFLSEQLQQPLLVKRASDILGKYVGMTEKNIARAFSEAREDGAILLLDEVDSFLRSRSSATHGWEISHVNELLVQIEAFDGVLIACTNAFDTLDAAALRRFDVKVRFEPLTGDQVSSLFLQVLDDHGVTPQVEDHLLKRRLESLSGVTPGDFHAVVRRLRITGNTVSSTTLYEALALECSRKLDNAGRGIGFSANL